MDAPAQIANVAGPSPAHGEFVSHAATGVSYSLDNAFANGTKRNLRVLRALQYWALAVFPPTRHAFGGDYRLRSTSCPTDISIMWLVCAKGWPKG